jgi:hypothetical protein
VARDFMNHETLASRRRLSARPVALFLM